MTIQPYLNVQRNSDSSPATAQFVDPALSIREHYLDILLASRYQFEPPKWFVFAVDNTYHEWGNQDWFDANYTVISVIEQPPVQLSNVYNNAVRTANTAFGPISTTNWVEVKYIIPYSIDLEGGGVALAELKTGSLTPGNLIDAARFGLSGLGATYTGLTTVGQLVVSGRVAPGGVAEVDLTQVSGSVTFGSITAIERLL